MIQAISIGPRSHVKIQIENNCCFKGRGEGGNTEKALHNGLYSGLEKLLPTIRPVYDILDDMRWDNIQLVVLREARSFKNG